MDVFCIIDDCILSNIFSHLNGQDLRNLRLTNKRFRRVVMSDANLRALQYHNLAHCSAHNDYEAFLRMSDPHDYLWYISGMLIGQNRSQMMKYLLLNGRKLLGVCSYSMCTGNMELFRIAIGCTDFADDLLKINEDLPVTHLLFTEKYAAEIYAGGRERIKILEYIKENNIIDLTNSQLPRLMILGDDKRCLKFLHKNGCKFDNELLILSAQYRKINSFKYIFNRCTNPDYKIIYTAIIKSEFIECLTYLHNRGVMCTREIINDIAEHDKRAKCIEHIYNLYGCVVWDTMDIIYTSIKCGNVNCIKFVCEHDNSVKFLSHNYEIIIAMSRYYYHRESIELLRNYLK